MSVDTRPVGAVHYLQGPKSPFQVSVARAPLPFFKATDTKPYQGVFTLGACRRESELRRRHIRGTRTASLAVAAIVSNVR